MKLNAVQIRHRSLKTLLLICASFLLASNTQAASLEVVKGEYLVERATLSANGDENLRKELLTKGLKSGRTFGKHMVIGSALAAARVGGESPEYVPYDPADDTCKNLLASGLVTRCEPNFKVQINALPSDPDYSLLWGLSEQSGIDAARAWDKSTGSSDVVVAILDTGVDYRHPDLEANIWTNPWEIAGNNRDDDGNGYVDDVYGVNAFNGSGNPMDDNSHGTHVAGTIGAVGNNGIGVAGVNWQVKIMALKFLSGSGSGTMAGAVEAINYLIQMKQRGVNVRLANNSWGGGGFSRILYNAIVQANQAGIIFTVASGNESNDNDANPSYPASYDLPNIVSVGAIDQQQNLAWFSNYGALSVDIAAPGDEILSTLPHNSYGRFSGTSMATPHVTGALALLLASESGLSNTDLINRLYDSGSSLNTLSGVVRTGRTLNVARMLNNEVSPILPPPALPPSCSYTVSTDSLARNTSADEAALVMEVADEFSYQTISLPFSFKFDGIEVSEVTVSPNGVVYVGKQTPALMDYQSGAQAPINSIAALHADLVSSVRVAVNEESATIRWLASLYTQPEAGEAQVTLTIYADGRIHEWVDFTGAVIEKVMQNRSTVGLTGRNSSIAYTYAQNSKKVQTGMNIQYTPHCNASSGSDEVTISGVKLWGIQKGKAVKELIPGNTYKVRVAAASSGSSKIAQVNFFLDDEVCNATTPIEVSPGQTMLHGQLPRNLVGSFKRLRVAVDTVSASRRIENTKKGKQVRNRAITAERFGEVCKSMAQSLKSS